MKKTLLLLCMFGYIRLVNGQITTPIVKANFGIEADLSSNFFNNAPQPAVDDWFSNGYPGTGQFIIDTTGAAAIVAGYALFPATRTNSFSRLMRPAPYTKVNNRLVLDAVFHRDFHGDDSTVFAAGSNKNGMSPVSWNCPVSQGIPDKNDILDAFTHVRRAGPNSTDSLWMFAAISMENTTGSRYFDFELYQTDIAYNRSTQTFIGYGPDAGHTSWKFNAAGNIISPGDIVFTAEFSSATLSLVEARIWVKKTDMSITPTTFNWGGAFDGDGSGAIYGYANILPKTGGAFYTGIQNTVNTWAGPFSLVRVNNSVVTTYIPKQFMEFSVNLTKLGIEPASFSNNACGSPFRRVLVKTRSSTSFTAELKDFIAPFRMFDYPAVDANAYLRYFCNVMPPTIVDVTNPNASSVYTWSTTNGNILGPTTGPSITVNAPGTYLVTQQLHAQCPTFAFDTVTILFDAVCLTLNWDITKFSAIRSGKDAVLKWQVNYNEQVENYTIEYSNNNRVFYTLSTMIVNKQVGITDYSFIYPVIYDPATFYRIKATGKNGKAVYSKTVVVGPGNSNKNLPVIYPNPTNNEIWMSINASQKATVKVFISDITGRLFKTIMVSVNKGNNLLPLHSFTHNAVGMYIVKVKSPDGETTQKILLTK